MGYLKYISYLYLVMALVFAIDGVIRLTEGRDAIVNFLFAGLGIFMFFFRKRSYNNYQDRTPKN